MIMPKVTMRGHKKMKGPKGTGTYKMKKKTKVSGAAHNKGGKKTY